MRRFALIAVVFTVLAGGFGLLSEAEAAGIGPTSRLYLTQFSGTSGAIVQGNSVVGTFATTQSTETGIAVRDTVRIINGFSSTGPGSEYDLAGNVINAGIYSNTSFASLYDGTTDGRFNYAIDHNGNGLNQIFRFDLNWANPISLFAANQRSSGITYDAVTNTLWTTGGSGAPDGTVQNYSMTGTFISEFAKVPGMLSYALAWDPADDSLWLTEFGTSRLLQYSKAGVLLQTVDYGGPLHTNPFGAEFQLGAVVPEPSSFVLLGIGAFGLLLTQRRRRQRATVS